MEGITGNPGWRLDVTKVLGEIGGGGRGGSKEERLCALTCKTPGLVCSHCARAHPFVEHCGARPFYSD